VTIRTPNLPPRLLPSTQQKTAALSLTVYASVRLRRPLLLLLLPAAGVAELVPGVLFIDEVHMLDIECFTYLNRCAQQPPAASTPRAVQKALLLCVPAGCARVLACPASCHTSPGDQLDVPGVCVIHQ
jgi:hypothetical protein